MMEEKIILIGQIKAKKGLEETVKGELKSLMAQTRNEQGNLHYDMYQAIGDKSLFLFHESWENQQALDNHMEKSYIKSFLAKEDELLAEPIKGKQIKVVD